PKLFLLDLLAEVACHCRSLRQRNAVMDPLPDLRARELCGRGVFHEVVDRRGSGPAQPGYDVLDPDAHVRAQSGFGDGGAGDLHVKESLRVSDDLGTPTVELIRLVAEDAIELGHRGLDEIGVRDPRSVEAIVRLADLVI